MKTKNAMLTFVICSGFISSLAQTMNDKMIISLLTVNTVVVNNVSGDCSIFQSKSNELSAKCDLFISGGNCGWRFPNERPQFKISSKQSNDTLYVEMPKLFQFKAIGISTYDEQIKSVLQIPDDKHIIIRQANKVTIEDEFNFLEIENTGHLECCQISKANMNSILCDATEVITINGSKCFNQFEFQGMGKGIATISANTITLNLK